MTDWEARALAAEAELASRHTFDVKDRLVVFELDENEDRETVTHFLNKLAPTATKLEEAGAIAVICLSEGVRLTSLNEQQLAEAGLIRAQKETQ